MKNNPKEKIEPHKNAEPVGEQFTQKNHSISDTLFFAFEKVVNGDIFIGGRCGSPKSVKPTNSPKLCFNEKMLVQNHLDYCNKNVH